MDPKDIRELIDMISRSNFSTFELEEADGFKLRLVKEGGAAPVAQLAVGAAPVAFAPLPVSPAADPAVVPAAAPPPAAEEVDSGIVEFTSPIVGTFYGSPSPDAAVFAVVGSTIKKGQVLCIVEAMKVMNEIESEINAEVVEVCVTDGQPVEYGELLFRLRSLG